MRPALVALLLCIAAPARAEIVDTPSCRADIEEAKRLILKVAARDDIRTSPHVPSERFCPVLRLDLVDLTAVETLAARCLTGARRTQELAGLRQSVVITRRQLKSRCREGRRPTIPG